MYRLLLFLLLASALVMSGCTSKKPATPLSLSEKQRDQIRHVYVVPAAEPPRATCDFFASGKGSAALKGAGKGLGDTFRGAGGGGGDYAGVAMVVAFVVIAPIMMTGESVYYSVVTPGEKEQKALVRDVNSTTRSIGLQELLANEITVMGNRLTELQFERLDAADVNLSAFFEHNSSVAILNVATKEVTYDDDAELMRFKTGCTLTVPQDKTVKIDRKDAAVIIVKDPSAYLEDNATRLKGEIEGTYRTLADRLITSIFLEPHEKIESCGDDENKPCLHHYSGYRSPDALEPLKPETETCLFMVTCFERDGIRAGKAGTFTPMLEWRSFPPKQLEEYVEPGYTDDIEGVVYDLKISVKDRSAIVYARYGLREPRHKMEEALECGKEYAWSVRARYYKGGTMFASNWSRFAYGSYAFITPDCEDEKTP